ncbi:MAG TPA: hypothetical protein VGZ29_05775 [Terriglobia bacterium]|nr:hypothetical protein [Terriglobia bacterium]
MRKGSKRIATADDFLNLAEATAYEDPEEITLPHCGLKVILRKPRPVAFVIAGLRLPPAMSQKQSLEENQGQGRTISPEELELQIRNVRSYANLLRGVFVNPKLSLTPGPGEIHPELIPQPDQEFLLGWMSGEVGSDHSGLTSFQGRLRGLAASRSDGSALRVQTQRAPERQSR